MGCSLRSGATARADEPFDGEPINYQTAPTVNPITRLQDRIDKGEIRLRRDDRHGYLGAVLQYLKIPVSSQALVFSKTSFQRDRISPAKPRALYFDDDTYIGYVQDGEVLEVATTDAQLGPVFYTLDQRGNDTGRPRFVRQADNCLQCHGSSMTRDVPGLLLRSVFPDGSGQPILAAGTFLTDQTSPLKQRWGGWYVTGTHGRQRHMGNMTVRDEDRPERFDFAGGANLTSLAGKVDTSPYLSPHSDVVALMVLAHQAEMHNLLTRANYAARVALRDEAVMNAALGQNGASHSESAMSRIKSAGEPLVRYMLFAKEAPLRGRIAGTANFAAEFAARGPTDARGRSLRDLDLESRLFKYPCSYLIYSESFDGLPDVMKQYVYRRLWEVLSGADASTPFDDLSREDRRAILEILLETKRGLPEYWKKP